MTFQDWILSVFGLTIEQARYRGNIDITLLEKCWNEAQQAMCRELEQQGRLK